MRDAEQCAAAFISVGSNIEPERHINAALVALIERTEVASSSTFYRTTPIGNADQPMFVNGVWLIRTELEPRAVRDDLLAPVENLLGRRRRADKFAPRTIDLDLVLYDDVRIVEGDIRLPHPDIARSFVYGPILELLDSAGNAVEQGLRDRIVDLLPRNPPTPVGEVLEEFTEQLRRLLA